MSPITTITSTSRAAEAATAPSACQLGPPAHGGGRGADLRPGAEPVPGYRLEAFLGAGGYGEVWRAKAPGGPELDDAKAAAMAGRRAAAGPAEPRREGATEESAGVS